MRFAWLKNYADETTSVQQGATHPLSLIRRVYNAAFWVFLIPFFTAVPYSTGFIMFTIIILVRFGANLYTNNALNLTPAQYKNYPFRI